MEHATSTSVQQTQELEVKSDFRNQHDLNIKEADSRARSEV